MKTHHYTKRILAVTLLFLIILFPSLKAQVVLLTEGWESAAIGQTPPSGWSTEIFFGTNHTWFKQTGVSPSCVPYAGSRMVEFQAAQYGFGIHDRLKRTTPFATTGFTVVNVDFKWYTSVANPINFDRVDVQWSTNGTTWSTAGSFYRASWDNAWRFENLNLPAGATGQGAVYIAFHFYGYGGENCHLDDVHVTGYLTAPAPPTVTTTASTYVASTMASVNGIINANGTATTATFQYGLNTAYGTTVEGGVAAGSSPTPLYVILGYQTPLLPGRTYHYRAVGTSAGGTIYGNDMSFTTLDTVPTAITDDAYNITSTGATVYGFVSSNGDSTFVSFDYGTTLAYGFNVPAVPAALPADSNNSTVYKGLTGLTPNTLYHYRVKATNSLGTSYGVDSTFVTTGAGSAPLANTLGATSITTNSATLNGSVNPNGASTSVTFQYGLTASYGTTVTYGTVNGSTFIPVSKSITGLAAGTTYHFRVVATNSYGTAYGQDSVFTTNTIAPPTVQTGNATLVTGTQAQLHGNVNANGSSTTTSFQYGLTNSYGFSVSAQTVTGNTLTPINAWIFGLSPATTYHYRAVGSGAGGVSYGADSTFTTTGYPPAVYTTGATAVSAYGATLNGSANAYNSPTTITFEYGTTTSYGTTITYGTINGNLWTDVSTNISGLTPSTLYHYRVVGVNAYGTDYGYDTTFTTGSSANCQAAFVTYPDSLNTLLVHFQNQSSGVNLTSWYWDFGDGQYQLITFPQNPDVSHQYINPGTYSVCLTIQNNDSSCYDTYCSNVTVGGSPGCEASFSWTVDTSGMYQFIDQSIGNINAWYWNFGDPQSGTNNTSTLQNPTHVFSAPGTYYSCLTVMGFDSTCYDIFCDTIVVSSGGSCIAYFTYSANPNTSVPTQFVDLSQPSGGGPITSWYWTFDDPASGSNNVSTLQNPSHQFSSPGSYNVCLTIHGADSNCYDMFCKTVTVTGGTLCVANFEAYRDSANWHTFYFYDQSTPAPVTWLWSFGDGTSSFLQNPIHTYNSVGTFYVCLTMTSSAGQCTDTYCDTIVVENQEPDCESYFTYNSNGLTLNFTGHMVNGLGSSYSWNFGDGYTGQGQSVQHTYANAGTYTVILTTHNILDCQYTTQQVIEVIDSSMLYNLYGQVFGGNFPITSGVVMLFEVDSVSPFTMMVDTCMIDSLGIYYFTEVPEGNYYIYAVPFYPIGYLPTYFGDALSWGNATLVALGNPVNPYNIHCLLADTLLPGSGTINGQVNITGMKSSYLTDKIMVLLMNKQGDAIGNVRLNTAGEFSFSNLAYGTYLIKAELAGITSDLISVDLTAESPDTTLTMTFTGNKILGIEDPSRQLLAGNIYPNPATDVAYLVIQSGFSEILSLEIYSISGNQVSTLTAEVGKGETVLDIDTGSLPGGFYLVRMVSPDNRIMLMKKLIISE